MEFRIYNTMSRQVEVFSPLRPDYVGVYTCGPTVYHHAHLGNLRTYIASDMLVRTLRALGYTVRHVMNITDVGHLVSDADDGVDKIELGAAREGISAWDIAKRYTDSFFEQCDLLNIKIPDVVCRATEHIDQQIGMIKQLEARGFTYVIEDGVYFDTGKISDYGHLARLDIEGLREGARVNSGNKRNKTDFALWKLTKVGDLRQMEWDSPWGRGFPGWHIECSAMSTHYLGNTFDIHTGGIDHIPVHHTNEIAQSECATGAHPFVRYWMHSNFLQMGSSQEKMAKSKGDFVTAFTLDQRGFDPVAFRFLCLKAHYRTEMKFTWEALEGVAIQYRRIRQDLASVADQNAFLLHQISRPSNEAEKYKNDMMAELANDLATPAAFTIFQRALGDQNLDAQDRLYLAKFVDEVFGLELLNGNSDAPAESITDDVAALVLRRNEARQRKDWPAADQLRREIEAMGYVMDDTPSGTTIKRQR
jgi:cysteinyl-tRNA synthetase